MKKNIIISASIIIGVSQLTAQTYLQKMKEPNANFYEIQKTFYEETKGNLHDKETERKNLLWIFKKNKIRTENEERKEAQYSQFKRWEWFWQDRVMPDGSFPNPADIYNEFEKYTGNNGSSKIMVGNGNWVSLGPKNQIITDGDMGRLQVVRLMPGNNNVLFVGAANGGMWRSNDGGATWSTTTDRLGSIGVSDIAIDPSNTNTIYIATGDKDAGDSYGIGVLKSTDGGVTWKQTGLVNAISASRSISRLLIHPTSPNILFASTSSGIYKTTDGGNMWYVVSGGNYDAMEFKTDDPNTIFACGANGFVKSTNGGKSFSGGATGYPTGITRAILAVTPHDPNYIFILAASNNPYGATKGVYRSTDGGATFTARNTTTDFFGSNNQGWYDITIAVSPTNKDIVTAGGISSYRSTNGGSSFSWRGPFHVDQHNYLYQPGSAVIGYAVSDGGIYKTIDGGANYTDLSKGLRIAQQYKIGVAQTNANRIVAGHQDNGSNMYNSGTWKSELGGDGMDCFIDWSDANVVYASSQNGGLARSTSGGTSFIGITNGITESGPWVTQWMQSTKRPNSIYAGYQSIYYSPDRGTLWTPLPSKPGSGSVSEMIMAPSDTNIIIVAKGSSLYKTLNHGVSWTNISSGISGGSITGIAISDLDPQKLWVSVSGFTSGKKVFKSIDGGASWTNYSDGLPNLPTNCIVYENGSADDGLYVGTDLGVLYKNNTLNQWVSFNNGLPNVTVTDLEIYYGATKKIRAGTYGVGTYESDLYTPAVAAPVAQFTSNYAEICPAGSIEFYDNTSQSPTAWEWTFSGGTPSTSTVQNPIVTYNTSGLYDVTLKATNAFGSNTVTTTSYMNVKTRPTISAGSDVAVCTGQTVQLSATGGTSYSWIPSTGLDDRYLSNPTFSGTSTRTYTVTGVSNTLCTNTDAITVTVYNASPAISSINQAGNILTCTLTGSGITYQWYFNGNPVSGATAVDYDASAWGTGNGNYTVMVTNPCGSTLSNLLTVTGVGIDENTLSNSLTVLPNPSNGIFTVNLKSLNKDNYTLTITNVLGQVVYTESLSNYGGEYVKQFDLNKNGKGIYFIGLKNKSNEIQKKIVVQ